MTAIVLASASPRRKALLDALGLTFHVIVSDVPERFEGTPTNMVVANARAKRDDVARRVPEVLGTGQTALVVAADTLVFLDDHVLGKPRDLDEARRMLMRLSGRTHQVLTGLSIVNTSTGGEAEGSEATNVRFRRLTPAEIETFVHAVNPVDRAGAYTVDGPGSLLVERYDGCYYNVLGLPIVRLDTLLRGFGFSLFDRMDAARSAFL